MKKIYENRHTSHHADTANEERESGDREKVLRD
jgi:hypothetical protein